MLNLIAKLIPVLNESKILIGNGKYTAAFKKVLGDSDNKHLNYATSRESVLDTTRSILNSLHANEGKLIFLRTDSSKHFVGFEIGILYTYGAGTSLFHYNFYLGNNDLLECRQTRFFPKAVQAFKDAGAF